MFPKGILFDDMNLRSPQLMCLCGAICGGAVLIWYWVGLRGESVPMHYSPSVPGRFERSGYAVSEPVINNQSIKHMNDSIDEFHKERDFMPRIIEISHSIWCRLDEVPGVEGVVARRYDETEIGKVLHIVSREEWVFICIVDLIRTVRNDGSCGYNGLQGYQVRNYLREVGIERFAELFESLYPLAQRIDEIEGQRQDERITDDEYDVLVEPINIQMEKMEAAAGVESFNEMYSQLLRYATEHGFADVAAPDRSEHGQNRRE